MANTTKDSFERILEDAIDGHGLASVLGSLAEVCNEKAEHIATNWQDETLARRWEKAADMIDNIADKLPKDVG